MDLQGGLNPPPEPRRREDVDHSREPCPHRIVDGVFPQICRSGLCNALGEGANVNFHTLTLTL
jgi:hypothetical protein